MNRRIGWYPELVFLAVVFSNSNDLEIVIHNSIVKINFLPYNLFRDSLTNTCDFFRENAYVDLVFKRKT